MSNKTAGTTKKKKINYLELDRAKGEFDDKKKKTTMPPKDNEMLRIILARMDFLNPTIAGMLEVTSLTGLRYSDVSLIRVSDILVSGNIVSEFTVIQQKIYNGNRSRGVSVKDSINKASITIPVHQQTKAVFEDMITLGGEDGLLFKTPRDPSKAYSNQYTNRLLSKIALEIGFEPTLGSHSFRKAFARNLVESNATLAQIRDMLGQSSLTSTNHYLSSFSEERSELAKKIEFK